MPDPAVTPHSWSSLADVPAGFGPSAVTIGNFDGVHRGHRAVVDAVTDQARRRRVPAVAVTFEPHPLQVLRPAAAPGRICSSRRRRELLTSYGINVVLTLPFTAEFALWEPETFVRTVLVDRLRAQVVVVGEDTRFGRRNLGDVALLADLGHEYGFDVEVVPDVGDSGRWSSTLIREVLSDGDVAAAARLLGRLHRVSGTVVHGDHRGRLLGFPTANLEERAEGLLPTDGVYAGWVTPPHHARMPAAIHVGDNRTFDGTHRRVEAHVVDRDDLDLYGRHLDVDFLERVRGTERFESVDALVAQMHDDVARCRDLCARAES